MQWTYDNICGYQIRVLGLTANEVSLLQSLLKKELAKLQKRYDTYLDIHESGEATERQEDALLQAENDLRTLTGFLKAK